MSGLVMKGQMNMRNVTWIVVGLSLQSAAASSATGGKAREINEINEVVGRFFEALNDNNISAVLSFYHDGSAYFPKNHPASRGIGEISKAYQDLFGGVRLKVSHQIRNVSLGDIAVVESDATGSVTVLASGQVVRANVKELLVLRKIANAWKVDRYMFNDNEEQCPAPAKP